MKSIIFICHGNICRSPAAEFIAKHYLKSIGRDKEFVITSSAVSLEEIGNDIYPPMKSELARQNIPFSHHRANRISQADYEAADYIFYMDSSNKAYLERLFGTLKSSCLPINCYTPSIDYIEDPWYTDRFYLVVEQIKLCVKNIFENI